MVKKSKREGWISGDSERIEVINRRERERRWRNRKEREVYRQRQENTREEEEMDGYRRRRNRGEESKESTKNQDRWWNRL